ncbi:hypothetical protein V6Z11_D03G063500 [Gossypium hirsutum]
MSIFTKHDMVNHLTIQGIKLPYLNFSFGLVREEYRLGNANDYLRTPFCASLFTTNPLISYSTFPLDAMSLFLSWRGWLNAGKYVSLLPMIKQGHGMNLPQEMEVFFHEIPIPFLDSSHNDSYCNIIRRPRQYHSLPFLFLVKSLPPFFNNLVIPFNY